MKDFPQKVSYIREYSGLSRLARCYRFFNSICTKNHGSFEKYPSLLRKQSAWRNTFASMCHWTMILEGRVLILSVCWHEVCFWRKVVTCTCWLKSVFMITQEIDVYDMFYMLSMMIIHQMIFILIYIYWLYLNTEYHSHPYTMSNSLISLKSPLSVFHWATEATGQVQAEANATYNATAYAEATYTVVDPAPGMWFGHPVRGVCSKAVNCDLICLHIWVGMDDYIFCLWFLRMNC